MLDFVNVRASSMHRIIIWQCPFDLVLGQSIKKAHGIKFNNFSLLAQIEFNISAHQLKFNIFRSFDLLFFCSQNEIYDIGTEILLLQ